MTRAIGIDTGGTFTDFIWLDTEGRLCVHKEPSTPADPSRAIMAGLARAGLPDDVLVLHGSTVATNALLQRRGARAALVTTAGFADVLEIGRQNRPELYALVPQKPPPLVPREWRFELRERVGAWGEVVEPLTAEALDEMIDQLAAVDVESVAVCLLFSFLHPQHEQRVAAAVEALAARTGRPLHLSLSSRIMPEYREFERTAATVINAYVGPMMSRYLERLAADLAPRRLSVMQSNGGLISGRVAGDEAIRTVLSGPAGGVVGARYVARMTGARMTGARMTGAESAKAGPSAGGIEAIITFDMGGTSTDVALCPGRLPTTTDGEIAGLPLRIPIIDIHTVGAGGGSLAHVDAGGALHVGPESAGASPGPACYVADFAAWRARLDAHFGPGRATVTDANLVLGRLDAGNFLAGDMSLYESSADKAIAMLTEAIGADSPQDAAAAVIRVANATMERAVRRISVERGHDPRRFTLVAFGGGGPLHACELAEQLGIPQVMVPTTPGVLSALGMLAASPARDYSRSVLWTVAGDETDLPSRLEDHFAPLLAAARRDMVAEGHAPDELIVAIALDMRYLGQSHELSVMIRADDDAAAIRRAFDDTHAARYGYARPEVAVEIVTARLTAAAAATPPAWPAEVPQDEDAAAARVGEKAVWFEGGFVATMLYDRQRLRAGNKIVGPAVLFQYDTTTLIPPNWQAVVDVYCHLLLRRIDL